MSITIHPLEVSKPWYNKYENNSDTSNDGSGSGSGSGEDSKIYFKFPDDIPKEIAQNIIAQFAILFGCVKNGKYIVVGSGVLIEALNVTYKSCCADGGLEILHTGEVISLDKYVQSMGMPSLKDALISTGCTEITKEQFYNLEV